MYINELIDFIKKNTSKTAVGYVIEEFKLKRCLQTLENDKGKVLISEDDPDKIFFI